MNDMTQGKPIWVILKFTLPIMVLQLFNQLYVLVDTMVVGKVLGEAHLAALGSVSILSILISGFLRSNFSGYGIIIAGHFGAKRQKELRHAIAGTIILSMGMTLFFTVVSLLSLNLLLALLRIPEEIRGLSYTYMSIILGGLLFSSIFNMFFSILMSVGDSKTPTAFLILSSCLNIVLDILFVAVIPLGVAGAAIATVFSQLVSAVLCGIYIYRKMPELIPHREDFNLREIPFWDLFSMGCTFGLMDSMVNIGTAMMQSSVNSMGTMVVAGHTAARKMVEIICTIVGALEPAVATFTSQNFGAKQYKRIREGVRDSMILDVAITSIVVVTVLLFNRHIISGITGSTNAELLDTGALCLKVNAPFFYMLGALFVIRSALQGIGNKKIPLLGSLLELAGKLAAFWIFAPFLGYLGICITEPITWTICTVLYGAAYLKWAHDSKRELA